MKKTTLQKNKEGYGYCYTDLAEINKYCEDNDITYYQEVETNEINGKDYIITYIVQDDKTIKHRGCQIVEAKLSGINNPVQAYGSSLTYCRRYSLLMSLGLATEDDDAQSLSETKEWTYEEAQEYELTFGKHKGKKIKDIPQNYLDWLLDSEKTDLAIKTVIETFYKGKGINILTEEEKAEKMDLMAKLSDIMLKQDIDREKLLKHYEVKSDADLTIEQLKEAIEKLERKGK